MEFKLYVDFDNTMVDSMQYILDYGNNKFNKKMNKNDVKDYFFKDIFPEFEENEVVEFLSDDKFFQTIKPIDGCFDVLDTYKDVFTITILTARGYEDSENLKTFCEKYFPMIKNIICLGTSNKGILDLSDGIQIDDISRCLDSNALQRILFLNDNFFDWQKPISKEVINVNKWDEIGECFKWFNREFI